MYFLRNGKFRKNKNWNWKMLKKMNGFREKLYVGKGN